MTCGAPINLGNRAGWFSHPSTALPASASPHRGDGHGGGGASGAKHLVGGVGDRTVVIWGAGGHLGSHEWGG